MYRRFRESLSKPSMLILYLKDSRLMTIMYFFLLSFLTILPALIKVTVIDTFDRNTTADLYQMVGTMHLPLSVKEGRLTSDNPSDNKGHQMKFGPYDVFFDVSNKAVLMTPSFSYWFSEQGITFYFYEIQLAHATYQTLGLTDFDFKNLDMKQQNLLVKAFIDVFEQEKVAIKTIDMALAAVNGIGSLALIIVIMSALNAKPIAFKYKFKINTYAATVYALSLMFADLFGLAFLTWFGVVLFFVISGRAFSRLIGVQE